MNKRVNQTRRVNFRPLFYGFLAFGIGIGASYYVFSLDLAFTILIAVIGLLFLGFSIFKKQFISLIVVIACFVMGVGTFFVGLGNLTAVSYDGRQCAITGRVSTNIYDSDESMYLVLNDVVIDGQPSSNLALSIYKTDGFYAQAGMIVSFEAEVYDEFWFENGQFNTFSYKTKTFHNAFVESTDITIVSTNNLSFSEQFRLYVKNLLHSFMPFETAELSYSILFGDQTKLDSEIKQAFSTSGLGHLVAVSGLNIAVLVACLYFILKLFKTPRLAKLLIVGAILIFYCYLCGFAPSVVRASIMALVFLASGLLGRQYDLLSSLGVAGFIILIFDPFAVYDAGFLMSFASVLAIGLLVEPLTKVLNQKCRFPKPLANALAIDVITTLAIAPILAMFFSQISLFSVITNLVCVPIFSFAYILVFLFVILVSIFGFLGFLFAVPNLLLGFVIWFAKLIAGLDFAIVQIYSLSIVGSVAFYLVLFFFSKMFMASKMRRLVASTMTVIVGCTMFFACNVPNIPTQGSLTVVRSFGTSIVMTSKSGDVLVVSDGYGDVSEYLLNNNIFSVSTLVTCGECVEQNDFIKKYGVQNVVEGGDSLTYYGDFGVRYIYQNNIAKAVVVLLEDVGLLVACDRIGSLQAQQIRPLVTAYDIDVLFEDRSTKQFTQTGNFDLVLSNEKISVQNNYAANVVGSFTFSISGDIIGQVRSIN